MISNVTIFLSNIVVYVGKIEYKCILIMKYYHDNNFGEIC